MAVPARSPKRVAQDVLQAPCHLKKFNDVNGLVLFSAIGTGASGNFGPANPANISWLGPLERFR